MNDRTKHGRFYFLSFINKFYERKERRKVFRVTELESFRPNGPRDDPIYRIGLGPRPLLTYI